MPSFIDLVLEMGIHDLLARRVSHPRAVIGEGDIFLLIAPRTTWSEIQYFHRTVAFRSIRYDSAIVSFWLRGGTESPVWTSRTSIATASTGDHWARTWLVNADGCIRSHQFDLGPPNAEIRTLNERYRLAGLVFTDGPVGVAQTHPIPNTMGGG